MTAVAGVIWLAAIVTYWVLWTSASNFADDLKPIPAAIQTGSNAALLTGVVMFGALLGTAVIIQIRSGRLPRVQAVQAV